MVDPSPSRFKSRTTTVWKDVKKMLPEMEQRLQAFNDLQDIGSLTKASDSLGKFKDTLETKYESLEGTMDKWVNEINAIQDPNDKTDERTILSDYLTEKELDMEDVEAKIDEFSSMVEKSIKRKTENLKLKMELSSQQAQQDMIEKQAQQNISLLQNTITSPRSDSGNSPARSSHSHNHQRSNVLTLPEIELPTFSGDTWLYPQFIEQFNDIIHDNEELNDSQRHRYLRQCLKGEAKRTVGHIPETAVKYEATRALLKQAYHQPFNSRVILIRKMNQLSCNSSVQDQLRMTRDAKALIGEISAMCPDESFDVVQINLIEKYNENIRRKIYKKLTSHVPPTLPELLNDIEQRLMSELLFQDIEPKNTGNKSSQSPRPQNTPTRTDNATRSATQKCVFCGGHPFNTSATCWTVKTRRERLDIVRDNKICSKCLLTDHHYPSCNAACSKCGGTHHAALCPLAVTEEQSANNGTAVVQHETSPATTPDRNYNRGRHKPKRNRDSSPHPPTFVGAIHEVTALNQPTMLTGKVLVMNPNTKKEKEVDFFMDQGSMISVVSSELVSALKLPIIGKRVANITCFLTDVGMREFDIAQVTIQKDQFTYTFYPLVVNGQVVKDIRKNALRTEDQEYIRKKKIKLCENTDREGIIKPLLLIGNGPAQHICGMSRGIMRILPSGMILNPSILGYIIGGEPFSENGPLAIPQNSTFPTNHDKNPVIRMGSQHSNVAVRSMRHVNTKDNPADHLTRGLSVSAINDPALQYCEQKSDDHSRAKNPLHSYRAANLVPIVGDAVLIVDESGLYPRSAWPLAIITKIDGHNITLRTCGGRLIERPHNLLIPLELSCNESVVQKNGASQSVLDNSVLASNQTSLTDVAKRPRNRRVIRRRVSSRRKGRQEDRSDTAEASHDGNNSDDSETHGSGEIANESIFVGSISIDCDVPHMSILQDKETQATNTNQFTAIMGRIHVMEQSMKTLMGNNTSALDQNIKTLDSNITTFREEIIETLKLMTTAIETLQSTHSANSSGSVVNITPIKPFPNRNMRRSWGHTDRTPSGPTDRSPSGPTPPKQIHLSKCMFCGDSSHRHAECPVRKSRRQRLEWIWNKNLCDICLQRMDNHADQKCVRFKCDDCAERHHQVLCPKNTSG